MLSVVDPRRTTSQLLVGKEFEPQMHRYFFFKLNFFIYSIISILGKFAKNFVKFLDTIKKLLFYFILFIKFYRKITFHDEKKKYSEVEDWKTLNATLPVLSIVREIIQNFQNRLSDKSVKHRNLLNHNSQDIFALLMLSAH